PPPATVRGGLRRSPGALPGRPAPAGRDLARAHRRRGRSPARGSPSVWRPRSGPATGGRMRPRAVLIDLDGVLRRWGADDAEVERAFGLPAVALREVAFGPDLLQSGITGAIADAVWRDRIADDLRSHFSGADGERAVSRCSSGSGEVDDGVL